MKLTFKALYCVLFFFLIRVQALALSKHSNWHTPKRNELSLLTDVLSLITLFKTIGLIEGKHLLFDQEFKLATDPRSLISGNTHYHKKQNTYLMQIRMWSHTQDATVTCGCDLSSSFFTTPTTQTWKGVKKEEELNFNLTFYLESWVISKLLTCLLYLKHWKIFQKLHILDLFRRECKSLGLIFFIIVLGG